ncbi:MFS transporter [Tannerella forsythia]|uniref:MFS transporter n=1 Tax=Tannerella forsythia TaxID=28112 RepID=A0A3P1YPR0_TANFO|nr:MFS transporter [Tannerella forsythia]RRD72040.1 MFS transporter [Tannerella forsythia]
MKHRHSLVGQGYMLPFVLITFFFFLWGFARAILDVLNPFFQETFQINKTQASLIQFVTYLAYFLMAVPAGMMIRRYGTRKGVVVGLLAFGGAALAFVASRFFGSYIFWFYLLLLFIIGCGLACLEVAANPYVTLLGDKETAAGRINRAQSFNGLGCICGSLLGGIYCFSVEDPNISIPYAGIGVIVLVIAVLFSRVRLPEFVIEDEAPAAASRPTKGLTARPLFLFGLFALFCYEIAEIAINSFFINYAVENHMVEWFTDFIARFFEMHLHPKFIASIVLSVGLLLFMLGRFAGSMLMQRVRAEQVLFGCAIGTVTMTALVVMDIHGVSFVASILIFVFESIMFPTIFALSIKGLGALTQKASAVLMMTPIGGAVGTVLMGMAADRHDMTFSFLVPLTAFVVILIYAVVLLRKRPQ